MGSVIKTAQKIKMLKTREIIPNPYQIRRNFEQKELESLAASLREVGMLSPVIVRRSSCGYELICGQRRHRAAIIAHIEEIPAIIVRAGDAQCAEISMIENIHRKEMGVFEEAEGFYNLMLYHKVKKDKLQKDLSVDSFRLNDKVRLLGLNTQTRAKLEGADIDERCIKQLLRIRNEEKQLQITDKVIEEHLSYKETEMLVDEILKEVLGANDKSCRHKTAKGKLPLFDNTVKKTVELLKKYGAKVEFARIEDGKCVEYSIKTLK